MMYPYTDSLLDPKNCGTKRVSRACDRCRLKKTKCDGRRCCNRCLADDAICVFSKRKRSTDRPYSSEYVQLLEDQQMKLVEGVQELYRKLRRGEGWTGPKIAEDSQGYPLVQDVLDSLAVLAPSERKSPKRKASEAGFDEQENDDDERSTPCEGSGRIGSASPPLSPLGCSQSSTTSSPSQEYAPVGLNIVCMPTRYQELAAKPMFSGQNTCPISQTLQTQSVLAECPEYWPISSPCSGAGGTLDFSGIFNAYTDSQTNCSWYPGTYMTL